MPNLHFGAKTKHAFHPLIKHELQAHCKRLLVSFDGAWDNAERCSDILVQPLRISATSRARASPCFPCSLYSDLLPKPRFLWRFHWRNFTSVKKGQRYTFFKKSDISLNSFGYLEPNRHACYDFTTCFKMG
jgi:hypothetical protein